MKAVQRNSSSVLEKMLGPQQPDKSQIADTEDNFRRWDLRQPV
jgi:hypothetical protein